MSPDLSGLNFNFHVHLAHDLCLFFMNYGLSHERLKSIINLIPASLIQFAIEWRVLNKRRDMDRKIQAF